MKYEMQPVMVKKKPIDVTPYYHGIWCTVAGSEPFVNQIVHRRWSEDGSKIIFMLDTFNFSFENPDEEMQVVEGEPNSPPSEKFLKQDLEVMANRPKKE